MHFAIDWVAALLLAAVLVLMSLLKTSFFSASTLPSLAFSKAFDLKRMTWRLRFASLPGRLHVAAIVCLMIAFIDPHFLIPRGSSQSTASPARHRIPTEGSAIYLALDRSGSMAEPAEGSASKLEILKQVTSQFILHHPNDLMGLVSFARVPEVLVPLTLDQQALLQQLGQIQVAKNNEEDGTAIGYAIYKTANLLSATRHFANDPQQKARPPYTIKSAIIIVVTDGFQDPNRLDKGNRLRTLELDDAAAYVKSRDIRLYVINIDPTLATEQYAPQRRQLQKITALTGGKFYLVNDSQALQDIYDDIDRLEKGTIEKEVQGKAHTAKDNQERVSLYPFFIALGMLSLFSALLLETTLLRKVP